MFEFTALYNVSRMRKRRNHFILFNPRVAAAMIEVEVGIDHDVDILWMQIVIKQAFGQVRTVQRENITPLRVPFISRAGFHKNGLASGTNEQAIHRQLDPISGIGWDFLFPHRLRDDSEHRAAIKS